MKFVPNPDKIRHTPDGYHLDIPMPFGVPTAVVAVGEDNKIQWRCHFGGHHVWKADMGAAIEWLHDKFSEHINSLIDQDALKAVISKILRAEGVTGDYLKGRVDAAKIVTEWMEGGGDE